MPKKKDQHKTTKYHVSFILEVDGEKPEETVEEVITATVDEELNRHREGRPRSGVRFVDAVEFRVKK